MTLRINSLGLNQPYSRQIAMRANSERTVQAQEQIQSQPEYTLTDVFKQEHKKNGLVERAYNGVKNLTGLGTGSKKVKATIAKAENGEISEEEAQKTIDKYRLSQASSAQILGDGVSIAASGATFFALNKYGKYITAGVKVNKPVEEFATKALKLAGKEAKGEEKVLVEKIIKRVNTTLSTIKSNKRMMAITIGATAVVGAITKTFISKINRIGSKEFKVDKKDFNGAVTPEDKKAYKAAKKAARKAKRRANWRNRFSGAINGLLMPVNLLGGAIGVPTYLIGNSLNRYFIGTKTEEKKSMKGYAENLKNDAALHAGLAIATAIPMYKKANWTKLFNENIEKATKKLADARLAKPEFSSKTAFDEIKDLTLDNSEIQAILNNPNLTNEQKAQKIIENNIFAAKMKQIDTEDAIGRVLKDSCPATRSFRNADGIWDFTNAQKYIDEKLGEGYKISKNLGVGTVAETYLATDPKGNEVCVKILKEGITAEKIEADAKAIEKMIDALSDDVANTQKKDFLRRNLEDLKEGILGEIDFENEKRAALQIAKATSKAKVVKPIEVKNGVYIMEKAEGITLSSFLDINRLFAQKEAAEKLGRDASEIIEEINRLKERIPAFKDVKFDKKDTQYLLDEYQKVFIEQFHKIDPSGKTIHGDIHPGNIFINPEALKSRKGHLFTLIDTGNAINMSADQSIRALNISKYIDNGNVEEIAEYVLDGAKYPGKTKEEAKKLIVDELNKLFFDNKTQLEGHMYEAKVLGITDNIMQKLQIIPGSTQLNLNKTRTSATMSLEQIKDALQEIESIKVGEAIMNGNKVTAGIEGSKMIAKGMIRNKAYEAAISAQEKANLKGLTAEQVRKIKNNPTALKTNSEEYITYKLKQNILPREIFEKLSEELQ